MSESIGTARLDIVVDTSSLDAGVTKVKRSTQDMSKAAQDASQKMDAGTKRQVAALERQIATLGKSRSEVIRWRIEQQTSGRVAEELTAKLNAQTRLMASQAQAVAKFGDSAKRAAASWLALSAASGTAAFVFGIKGAIDFADKLNDINIRLGISAEALSGWAFAAKQTGTDIDGLGLGLKKLAKNMGEATDSTSSQGKLFAALGVQVKDAQGNLRRMEDVLPEIASKFKAIQNETLKAALAQEVFGKSGTDLIEFLNQGADGLEGMRAKARELGVELSQGSLSAADQFKDRLEETKASVQGLFLAIAPELLPAMTKLADAIRDTAKPGTELNDVVHSIGNTFEFVSGATSVLYNNLAGLGDIVEGLTAGFFDLSHAAKAALSGNFGLAKEIFSNSDADSLIGSGIRRNLLGVSDKRASLRPTATAPVGMDITLGAPMTDKERAAFEKRLTGTIGASTGAGTHRKPGTRKPRLDFAKDARDELQRLLDEEARATDAFKDLEAQLQGPMAVALRDHEKRVAELNELAKRSPDASARLSEALNLEEQRHKEVAKAIKAQQNPIGLLLEDMKFELTAIGRSNAERVVMNELRRQGIDLMSKEAQAALATARAYDAESLAKGRSVELQDEFRQGVADAITDFVSGTKSATDALRDFFDEFAKQVTHAIANQWAAKLFGNQGENGGGAAGGLIGQVLGALSGGRWKDGGAFDNGSVMAFANGGVFDRPTFFGMSSGRLGVMGEAGPEAVLPLARGKDNKLGVRVQGDPMPQRGDFNQTVNIQVQGRLDLSTQDQVASKVGRTSRRAMTRNG